MQLTPLVLPAAINIGDAYSRGVEMEFDASLTQHISGADRLHLRSDEADLAQSAVRVSERLGAATGGRLAVAGHAEEQPRRSSSSMATSSSPDGEWRYSQRATTRARLPALSATVPHRARLHDARHAPELSCARTGPRRCSSTT